MDKSTDAFRTISEVAADLDLPQHVLRFWETRFSQIKPLKRGGGRRYYRPDDVDLLRGIRQLLYGEGYTIRGVQRILKEQGVRFVMTLWQEGAPGLDEVRRQGRDGADGDTGADFIDEDPDTERDEVAPAPINQPSAEPRLVRGQDRAVRRSEWPREEADPRRTVTLLPIEPANPREPTEMRAWQDETRASEDGEDASLQALAQRFAPTGPTATARTVGQRPTPVAGRDTEPTSQRSSFSPLIDRLIPKEPRGEPEPAGAAGGQGALSRDEVRRLQATLFELLECKRLLDQAR